jgi:PAS domain S-box-containing protein
LKSRKDLSGFSAFLLENIDEVSREALRISKELDVPMLKYLVMPDEDLLKLIVPGYTKLLNGFIDGTADKHVQETVASWKANQLPVIERDQVVSEDIPLVMQARKRLFLHFLPRYTTDLNEGILIIRQLDDHLAYYATESYRAYTNILQAKIEKHVDDLRHNDRLFRQAQAVTKIGNYVWSLKDHTLKWSDELYRIYEIGIGSNVSDGVLRPYNHPDDNVVVDESIGESIKTGKPFNFHYRIILNDGREKILHARGEVEYDPAGNALTIFGTAQDVTEQKTIEYRLEQNQKFIQKVADAAPAIITTYNVKTGEYLFVSEGLRKLLGYAPQDAIREGTAFITKLLHADDVAPAEEQIINEFQNRLRHANGEYRWFHTFGTVFDRDSSGEVQHILNISLDITEKIKAEQILHQKTTELQQSNRSLEEFAFIASHDLKEPLRKISTLTDRLVLIENANLSEDGKSYLQKVVNSSIRMQQMIDDLLSLAQVSADRSFQKVNLHHLFNEVIQTFDQKIEETNTMVLFDGLPEALVVPSQFRQLFQNLLSNSLKFRRTDVPAVVELKHEYLNLQAAQQYDLQSADRYLKLTFTDNGIGFDNKFLPKIFSIFQRLHPRNKYEGNGIGLSICKRIVENHSGIMLANGTVNEGATFTVIIPETKP